MASKIISKALHGLGGRFFGYRETPLGTPATDPLVKQGTAVAEALFALSDKLLTVTGATIAERSAAVAGEHALLQARLAAYRKATDAAAAAFERAQYALDNPPAISAVADILADQELRDWFQGAPQQKLFVEMANGKHPDLLAALCRFEPSEEGQKARQIFRDRARALNRQKVRTFETEEERLTWARTNIIEQTESALNEATPIIGSSVLISVEAIVQG